MKTRILGVTAAIAAVLGGSPPTQADISRVKAGTIASIAPDQTEEEIFNLFEVSDEELEAAGAVMGGIAFATASVAGTCTVTCSTCSTPACCGGDKRDDKRDNKDDWMKKEDKRG